MAASARPMTPGQQHRPGDGLRIHRGELTGRCCIGASDLCGIERSTASRPAPIMPPCLLHPAGVVVAARTAGL